MPATARDAKGLLKSAIRDDSPVVFIENRNLYYKKQQVPEGELIIPIGEADIVRAGEELTIVTMGNARYRALDALELLGYDNSVELIDIRTVDPFDMDTILNSLKKTGKIIIIQEAPLECGIGAELVRRIVCEGFDFLDAPPLVIGGKNVPTPFSPILEDYILPSEQEIAKTIDRMKKDEI
jgi:pyruvate dehydrogenase E1 component beta subunit